MSDEKNHEISRDLTAALYLIRDVIEGIEPALQRPYIRRTVYGPSPLAAQYTLWRSYGIASDMIKARTKQIAESCEKMIGDKEIAAFWNGIGQSDDNARPDVVVGGD